jgi:hypothetical protein
MVVQEGGTESLLMLKNKLDDTGLKGEEIRSVLSDWIKSNGQLNSQFEDFIEYRKKLKYDGNLGRAILAGICGGGGFGCLGYYFASSAYETYEKFKPIETADMWTLAPVFLLGVGLAACGGKFIYDSIRECILKTRKVKEVGGIDNYKILEEAYGIINKD